MIQRGDNTFIMGGCGWTDKDEIQGSGYPDAFVDSTITQCLRDELDAAYPDNEARTTHAWSAMECWVESD